MVRPGAFRSVECANCVRESPNRTLRGVRYAVPGTTRSSVCCPRNHAVPGTTATSGVVPTSPPVLPELSEFFVSMIPRKIRRDVYEPIAVELQEDYLVAYSHATTPKHRRFTVFYFRIRTRVLLAQCWWAWLGSGLHKVLEWFGVAAAAEIVRRLFF
jgi:hypothetical protein